jgi:signal transduction histidine kinase
VEEEIVGGPVTNADQASVAAVLGHLLGNALKFSAPQGLVKVRLDAREDGIGIIVSDPGIGIPVAELGRIGEPFYHASNVGGRGGLGLGLFIVRRIAELHRGSVTISARPQGGTVVQVELPASPD